MARPNESVKLATTPRWVAPVFAVLGAATIPWTVYLAMTLPERAESENYRLAWVGFDTMLIVVLLATAYVAWRGHRLVGLLATVTATMLLVDAWFDVTSADSADRMGAVLSAVVIELPLAAACGWITLHVDQVIERRLRRLARRAGRLSPTGAEAPAHIEAARVGAAQAVVAGKVAVDETRAAERTVGEAEKRA